MLAVDDLAERAAIRAADERQWPVRRVAERDHVRTGPVLGQAEQVTRQVLVLDARLAAADGQAGRREHQAHGDLAEVELDAVLLQVGRWQVSGQRDRRRGRRHVASARRHEGQLLQPPAIADDDEVPRLRIP